MKKKSNLDILMIMFGFTFFSGSMLIGQKLSSGVEFSDFLVCILIGGTILGIFGGILGYIGAKTGNSMKELSHKSFGKKGSYLPSLLVGITQIGWYGVGISMFAVPVANLIFPNNIFALYSLIILFGVFMTISTYIGIDSITKVSYLAAIVILLFGFISIIYAFNRQPIDILSAFGNGDKISLLIGLQMVIGSYISGAITTPNFSKYGENPKFIAIICFCAFLLGNGLMIIFGASSNILVGGSDIFNIFTYFIYFFYLFFSHYTTLIDWNWILAFLYIKNVICNAYYNSNKKCNTCYYFICFYYHFNFIIKNFFYNHIIYIV